MDRSKLLINNRRGRLVGEEWLRQFGLLTKPEQDVLLFLMGMGANNPASGLTNQEIADGLNLPIKKVYDRTGSLLSKAFIDFYVPDENTKVRPSRKYYLSGESTINVTDPGYTRLLSSREAKSQPIFSPDEPTIDERTLRKIDADKKVGLI